MTERTRLFLLRGIMAVLCAVFLSLCWTRGAGGLVGDFSPYWAAGWWVRERPADVPLYYPKQGNGDVNFRIWTAGRSGDPAYDAWRLWGKKHGFERSKFYLYPPVFAVAFAPMTLLPLDVAAKLWGLLNGASLLGAMALIVLLSPLSGLQRQLWFSAAVAACLFWFPVWFNIAMGQNSLMLFFFWMLTIFFLLRNRDVFAGAVLASLILVKLSPVLLLPWILWRRRWTALASCAAVGIALTGLSAAAAGFAELKTYFTAIVPLLARSTWYYHNQSLLGFFLRASDPTHRNLFHDEPGVLTGSWHMGYMLALLVLAAATGLAILRHVRADSRRQLLEFASITLFMLLASALSWTHHYVSALLPLVLLPALWLRERPRGWPVLILCAAACAVLLAKPVETKRYEKWIAQHPVSWKISQDFFAGLGLWALVQFALWTKPGGGPPERTDQF